MSGTSDEGNSPRAEELRLRHYTDCIRDTDARITARSLYWPQSASVVGTRVLTQAATGDDVDAVMSDPNDFTLLLASHFQLQFVHIETVMPKANANIAGGVRPFVSCAILRALQTTFAPWNAQLYASYPEVRPFNSPRVACTTTR